MLQGLITVPAEDLRLLLNDHIELLLNHTDATEIELREPQPSATEGWRVIQDLLAKHDKKGHIHAGRTITLPERVVRDAAEYFDGKDEEEIIEGLRERADQQDYKEVLSSSHPLDVLQVAYSMHEAAMNVHDQFVPKEVHKVKDLRQAMRFLPEEMPVKTQLVMQDENNLALYLPLVAHELRDGRAFLLDVTHPQIEAVTISEQGAGSIPAGTIGAKAVPELAADGMPAKIAVTRPALFEVLRALKGPGHLIRELQALAGSSLAKLDPKYASPIDTLMGEAEEFIKNHKKG